MEQRKGAKRQREMNRKWIMNEAVGKKWDQPQKTREIQFPLREGEKMIMNSAIV